MSKRSPRTTWDGKSIAANPPFGAAVILYRKNDPTFEFLLLHRAFHGTDYEGEWAWTPPSGARHPGEPIQACARRELREETGLDVIPELTEIGSPEWSVFIAEVPRDAQIHLDGEHDRFAWLPLQEALLRCHPKQVSEPIKAVGRLLGLER